ncbi:MAG TPA: GNAT family N-acetyltransferase [Trebonia sp.]|jgi:ribosomal protein S18 acetylase RimI-like enzyme
MTTSFQSRDQAQPQPAAGMPSEPHILDNAVWAALTGPHQHLAETFGSAARYPADVSPFAAISDASDPLAWNDLATLVGPGNSFALKGVSELPAGWDAGRSMPGVQMVATTLRPELEPEAVRLGAADVPEMLDLAGRTKPGPFEPRTIELGAYWGIRRGGRLIAMGGERMHPPGWTEISAVCTDEACRGQGLATRLIRHLAVGIGDRGDTPFLHTVATNTGAIRLYESIGFTLRRPLLIHFLQVPPQDELNAAR